MYVQRNEYDEAIVAKLTYAMWMKKENEDGEEQEKTKNYPRVLDIQILFVWNYCWYCFHIQSLWNKQQCHWFQCIMYVKSVLYSFRI